MSSDRRGAPRYGLVLPVQIDGSARGFTRNIGMGGALVVSPIEFRAGDPLDLVIDITFSDPDLPTRLACSARVRRVHKLRAQWALAVEFDGLQVLTQAAVSAAVSSASLRRADVEDR
jgi:hypothetical protein